MRTIEEITLTTPLLGLAIICLLSLPAGAQYGGGTGEPNDPYLIYTAEQMNEIGANWREDWDKHFKLMADINLGSYVERDFRIIGANSGNAFRGVFDGNGKRITDFTYSATNRSYAGLFGYLKGAGAEIRNLGLVNPNIDVGSGSYVGSLVGHLDDGTITNCYARRVSVLGKNRAGGLIGYARKGTLTDCRVKGGSVSGNEEVGGLAGYNQAGIEKCYATCRVSGNTSIGGLIGDNRGTIANSTARGRITAAERDAGGLIGDNSGLLTNCSARGDVLGSQRVGGLAGSNDSSITNCCASGNISGENRVGGLVGYSRGGTINNCYARGTTTGDQDVGGLVGNNREIIENCYATGSTTGIDRVGGLVGRNTWPGKINCCYSIGTVIGTTDVGGLVGFNDEAIIKTSFWDVQTSGRSDMCGRQELGIGCDNAGGRTTVEMQRKSTFLGADWDFGGESENGTEDIWSICDGLGYPELLRQFVTGDFDGNNRVDLADFAVFAERWLSADRSFFWCRGADLTGDGEVGVDDLRAFADNWLAEGIPNLAGTVYRTVDDFESYNDLDPNDPESNRIFDTWLDGYYNRATNGSVVGYDKPPYAERNIVHGGMQSMPYSYNDFFKFSKAELPISPPQDWTEEGIGVLSLWFRGNKANAPAPMNVVINGSSPVYHDNPDAVKIDAWTGWTIDLEAFTGVDLTNVSSIAICFGDQNDPQPGGSGRMFFDDIRLCRLLP